MGYRTTVNRHPFFVDDDPATAHALLDDGDVYVTTDLLLAGFLLASGHRPDVVVWSDAYRNGDDFVCGWSFVRTPETDTAAADFASGAARVEPREFYRNVNHCRAAMNDARPRR